jgi:hypothetical protein
MPLNLAQFVASDRRNAWIREGVLDIYVRRHNLWIDQRGVLVLALANMASRKPGKGAYRKFLAELQHSLPQEFAGIFVECIHNERLYEFHVKLGGWKPYGFQADHSLVWFRP